MVDDNVRFCNSVLRMTREDIRKSAVLKRNKISNTTFTGIWTYRYDLGVSATYEVQDKSGRYWHGSAFCSTEAKNSAIHSWIRQELSEADYEAWENEATKEACA